MSFGFSVGDIITVGKLAYDLSTSLGGGAKEYRTICSSLESLSQSLGIAASVFGTFLDSNNPAASNNSVVSNTSPDRNTALELDRRITEGIKAELKALRRILNNHELIIAKYEPGYIKRPRRIKDIWRTFKWSLEHEGAAKELESKLLFHTNTFQSYVLQVIYRGVSKTEEHVKESFDEVKGSVDEVKGSVDEMKGSVDEVKGSATEALNGLRQIFVLVCLATTVLLYVLFLGTSKLPTAHSIMDIDSAVNSENGEKSSPRGERKRTSSGLRILCFFFST